MFSFAIPALQDGLSHRLEIAQEFVVMESWITGNNVRTTIQLTETAALLNVKSNLVSTVPMEQIARLVSHTVLTALQA